MRKYSVMLNDVMIAGRLTEAEVIKLLEDRSGEDFSGFYLLTDPSGTFVYSNNIPGFEVPGLEIRCVE